MQRQKVEGSRKVRSWGYDASAAILEVEYVWGSIVQYFGVPQALAANLPHVESKGSFLAKFIERKFEFRRLASGEDQLPPGELKPEPETSERQRDAKDHAGIYGNPGGEAAAGNPGKTKKRRVRLI